MTGLFCNETGDLKVLTLKGLTTVINYSKRKNDDLHCLFLPDSVYEIHDRCRNRYNHNNSRCVYMFGHMIDNVSVSCRSSEDLVNISDSCQTHHSNVPISTPDVCVIQNVKSQLPELSTDVIPRPVHSGNRPTDFDFNLRCIICRAACTIAQVNRKEVSLTKLFAAGSSQLQNTLMCICSSRSDDLPIVSKLVSFH